MTRYTRYPKKFNPRTISDEQQAKLEASQVESDRNQSVDDLRASKNHRSKPVCLKCRKRGHTVKFCPQGSETTCYNCGARDHSLKACPKPVSGGLKFASCYICKEPGHISKDCPKNERGMDPRGGGCRFCGSAKHLARDCRPTKEAQQSAVASVSVDPKRENPDDDLVTECLQKIQAERDSKRAARITNDVPKSSKKKKVIKF